MVTREPVEARPAPGAPADESEHPSRRVVASLRLGLLVPIGVAMLAMPPTAGAQAISGLIGALRGDAGGSVAVEPEEERRAVEVAHRSFDHAAEALASRVVGPPAAASGGPDAERGDAYAERIAAASDAFLERARERLIADKGDGVLTRAELAGALAEARTTQLDSLEEALRAALTGADPPPDRDAFESWGDWAAALAVYTVAERNASWRWGLAASLLLAGLVVAGITARGLVGLAGRLGDAGGRLAARAAESLSGPLYFAGTVVALRAAIGLVWLPVGVREAIGVATGTLLALALLWIVWNAASGLVDLLDKAASRTRGRMDDDVVGLLRKTVRIVAIGLFGVFVVDSLVGVELTSVLAGLGVLGIVASIAAQDTLRNLMAAFTIYGDRPFAEGDLVRIKGHLGNVEEIGFRSTRVRRLDGHRVTVPNAEVVRESVENLSARPSVRHHYGIDLVYATPPERVQHAVEILRDLLENEDHPPERPPRVSFEDFGPHSLRIELWYYSNTSDYWEARRHRTEVNRKILERFGEEELEFAFPTRSIHLESGPEALDRSEAHEDGSEPAERSDRSSDAA